MTQKETITDPARLLPAFSITPFWIEDRRREAVHHRIFSLYDKIKDLLDDYRDLLYVRCSPRTPRHGWEICHSKTVVRSFTIMAGTVETALDNFVNTAADPAWDLWEYHGFDDEEYSEALAAGVRELERNQIIDAFEQDFKCLIIPGYSPYDDLPF